MKQKPVKIHYWKTLERHDIGGAYPDVDKNSERFKRRVEVIKDGRIPTVTLLGGKVLDGWQRYQASLVAEVKPNFVAVPKGMTPEEFVEDVNDLRRHEVASEVEERVRERVARMAEARLKGQSIRAIAEAEKVSTATVQRNLKSSGVTPPVTPDKIVGQDGKKYDAQRQCERCKRVGKNDPDCAACADLRKPKKKKKNGEPTVNEKGLTKEFSKYYGQLIRHVDRRFEKGGDGKGHSKCIDLLKLFYEAYKAWKLEMA